MSPSLSQTNTVDPAAETYPVNLRLRDRPVLVVGGGRIAAGKIERLLTAGARITVVAPNATPDIARLAEVGRLALERRRYRAGEAAAYRLVITATGVASVDAGVNADAEAAGIWVNSADDVANCSFFLPAMARSGPVTVAIGTDGASPALASFLRRRYQADLDDGMVELATLLAATRAELRARTGTSEHPGWAVALDGAGAAADGAGLLGVIRGGRPAVASSRLRSALGLADEPAEPPAPPSDRVADLPLVGDPTRAPAR